MGGAEQLLLESLPFYKKEGIAVKVLALKETDALKDKLKNIPENQICYLTKRSAYNPLLIFKIIPYLKKYSIVHTHLFPALYWVVIAKWLSFSPVKLIYTEHNTHNRRRQNIIFKKIDNIIYKRFEKIITIAEEVDFNLKLHLRINQKKFLLIQNGINLKTIKNATPYAKSDFFSDFSSILIQISSFREQKDQPTLLRAMKELPVKYKLLLVGEGPLKKQAIDLAKNLKITDRVLFLGIRNDVPRLLKTADASVLSSKHEGLSLSSIEGMAVGKPFIASNVPGLREIVSGYGILFEQGNHTELAQKIENLFNNPEEYEAIAKKCYARAKEFDIEKMVSDYIQVYKSIQSNSNDNA
jgi:glycosyltransferase involved in cell wall biosynthesis